MKQQLLVLVLAAGCVVLGAVSVMLSMREDNNPPVVSVEEIEITYAEGADYSSLLKGVSAKDSHDGDLTDRVFVDRVIPLDNGKAVVYYGVLDRDKNVGTAVRKVEYVQNIPTDTQDKKNSETSDSQDDEKDDADVDAGPDGEEEELKPDGIRPAIALTADSAQIKAGDVFDATRFVKDVVDDKDDKNTLYRHIHADGNYDVNTAGTYELRIYVSDSEGNTSDVKTFSLTVQ
ncbi:hypothetical protein CE91St62_32420 [Lachnospiraceae bacterium]|uniref:hypothetical protein n=1 Tax=Extibacter sp. GGCC_0201 TaxID=2731209 RepID=UPI001AA0B4C4|nr:hypothetical protein [Extibacter sp. GGCC_0201]MBO1721990.1 hypothetical protein [Extibacter sp. GGCC_0201]BDF35180.1 hypothetical protein CE91St61_32550 [Lachnospiraceae bacterium]BDF39181.1 hypothetical protein CE91St62_32420 [Lachnospiraceae bacterium]